LSTDERNITKQVQRVGVSRSANLTELWTRSEANEAERGQAKQCPNKGVESEALGGKYPTEKIY